MSSGVIPKLAKPQLKGLLRSSLKRHITIAVIGSIISSVAYKFYILEPRKKRYADFYMTYDADKDYERMVKAGVFDHLPEKFE